MSKNLELVKQVIWDKKTITVNGETFDWNAAFKVYNSRRDFHQLKWVEVGGKQGIDSERYIRNSDAGQFRKGIECESDYEDGGRVLLRPYYATVKLATEKKVPLFDRSGKYLGNLGYPKGQPRPVRAKRPRLSR